MASKRGTVAPKERVNITYKPDTGNAQEEVALPLRLLVLMGDGRNDDTEVASREILEIRTKQDFGKVMESRGLELEMDVEDVLKGGPEPLSVKLKIRSLEDLDPGRIAEQVPEIRKQLELRNILGSLKGPLGELRALRERLALVLKDEAAVEQIVNYVRNRTRQEQKR